MSQRKVGVLISYISEGIKVLSGLLYTPIMLRLLGQSEYGLYQLVSSVVSYLGLLNFGFGSAYMRYYSRSQAENDHVGLNRLNGMFMTVFCIISLICILCGIVMLRNVKTVFGDSLSENEINKARVLLAIMVFNLALTFPDSVFNCYVIAHERFVFQKFLSLVQNIINPFLALPLLLMGFGSIGLVCVTTFLTVLRFSVDVWFCLKKLHMKFIFKGIQLHLIKEMWVFTFFIFLNQIIDCINWSIDKFLLGRLAGTTAVAIYGIGSQINQMYLDFSTAISNVFVPQVNRLIAEKSEDSDINRIFIKVGRIQFMILMLVLTGFVFFGKAFIRYWAGVGYEVSYYVTLLLIVPVTIPLIQNLGIEIQRAKNKHKARSVVYFLIAIVNVFISVPFIKLLGAAGAALGTAIALCAGNVVFINWYYHKKIGLDICNFWKQIASFMPAMAAPVALGIIIMRFVVISNLLYLLLYALLYSVVYCLSILCLGMNKDEKRMILSPIKRIFRRC